VTEAVISILEGMALVAIAAGVGLGLHRFIGPFAVAVAGVLLLVMVFLIDWLGSDEQ
jgi:hypothetical protein